ncbi:MAG: (d)CMP kinase [Myxococcales bacterium]|nr:(d)CMP kinase [Myxococcales bacterium]
MAPRGCQRGDQRVIIAIDGPAGAGKSTISQRLAARLGFVRLDTGALYRAVGLAATRAQIAADDESGLHSLVAELALRFDAEGRIWLGEEDVSEAIRTPAMSAAASRYAAAPAVRAGLLDLQRRLARQADSILDGRDIGTVVCPDADVKIFLTASVAERARRRHAELAAKGPAPSLQEVAADIEARDKADRERPIAPLRQADDAVVVDATSLSIDEVVARCAALVDAAR